MPPERMLRITCGVIPLANREAVQRLCRFLGLTPRQLLTRRAAAHYYPTLERDPEHYLLLAFRTGATIQTCQIHDVLSEAQAQRITTALEPIADQIGDWHAVRAALIADGFLNPDSPPVPKQ